MLVEADGARPAAGVYVHQIGPSTEAPVPDPQDGDLWLEINDVRRLNGNTRTQVFGVAHIVSYLSRFMALQAGAMIATGTPPGVGLGHRPPLLLEGGLPCRAGQPAAGRAASERGGLRR